MFRPFWLSWAATVQAPVFTNFTIGTTIDPTQAVVLPAPWMSNPGTAALPSSNVIFNGAGISIPPANSAGGTTTQVWDLEIYYYILFKGKTNV